MPGKIEQASEVQIKSKEFYLQTLEWQEDIWYLDDVVGGKRPRLQAEGDVYGTEENPVSVEESKEFYLQTLEWQEDIWYLDDVVGGKRPRLQAEGDVYGTEENPVSVEAPEMIQEMCTGRKKIQFR